MSDHPGALGNPTLFRFQDIGPVRDASLELGNLTVIAGRNNTGKTYIVYSLYGLLKIWATWPEIKHFIMSRTDDFSEVAALISGMLKTGRAEVPIAPATLARHRALLAERVSRDFSRSPVLPRVLNSRRGRLPRARIGVKLPNALDFRQPSPYEVDRLSSIIAMRYENGAVIGTLTDIRDSDQQVPPNLLALSYYRFVMRDVFPDPFILSAERFGISLFFRELDYAQNRIESLMNIYASEEEVNSPSSSFDSTIGRYTAAIKSNVDFTFNIPHLPRESSPFSQRNLLDSIKNMMGGYFSRDSEEIRLVSKTRKRGRFNIPLHLASSSARGLSGLYFYLRYAASRNDLLIIEEPESHLDTANQVQFARLLARFVNAGLRVLITTHSDYILRELNNLIMLSGQFSGKDALVRRLGYDPGDELQPGSVRAHVAKDGGMSECEVGPYGFVMPAFDDASNTINETAVELASRVGSGIE